MLYAEGHVQGILPRANKGPRSSSQMQGLHRYRCAFDGAAAVQKSQRLYYLPIIYAAYRYGLRGGLTASLVSAAPYFPHVVQRWNSEDSAINLYAETILFLVIGVVTGLLAGKERRERERYENAAAELRRAYDELRATVEQLLIADRHSSLGRMSAAIVH